MKTFNNIPFNYLSYWARIIPPPVWVERLDSFYKGTEDLDFYCLKIEGDEASFVEPSDYAKYTIEQFKFEEDFNKYYKNDE
jgi:hypothetical protein